MRAIRARYNPYLQAKHRLEQVSGSFVVCLMPHCLGITWYSSTVYLGMAMVVQHKVCT